MDKTSILLLKSRLLGILINIGFTVGRGVHHGMYGIQCKYCDRMLLTSIQGPNAYG
jgi:hypothetical protein